jgi:NADPH-dependent F420 reductase
MTDQQTIAVVGGTGPQGRGLAYRFARHGHPVVLGSRDPGRAADVADEVVTRLKEAGVSSPPAVTGASNCDAVAGADVVVIAVPWQGHDELVASLAEGLAGKLLISCVNPLGFDKAGPHGLDVPESAAESAARLVPTARVVGAFHHVSAVSLWSDEHYLDHEDVLVVGDDPEAKAWVAMLARTVTGRDGVDAGALRLARQLEPLTAVLISINKRYRIRSGIRISGL